MLDEMIQLLVDPSRRPDRRSGPRKAAIAAAAAACLILGAGVFILSLPGAGRSPAPTATESPEAASVPAGEAAWAYKRLADPARTVVRDERGGVVAVFTDGTRTVRLTGPVRTFIEPSFTTASVTTNAWVRVAPRPWSKGSERSAWFHPWLTKALVDKSLDVFGVAMEYIHGAPDRFDDNDVRYAGDASFGPVSSRDPDGRLENSDFLDYLGVSWDFPDAGTAKPKADRYGFVDCSGFLRLVYGYRLGYPLLGRNTEGDGLPRRAYAISAFGPGVLVIPNTGRPPRDFDRLQAGDLVFFETDFGPEHQTDHSGIYMGVDNTGHHRFISSRTLANGPTLGDLGGEAILDGRGYWAVRFRDARRI